MGTMTTMQIDVPFGTPVPEVPLPRAPLVLVVVQARFDRVASIANEEFIAGFQEAIRDIYPVMHREQQAGIVLTSDGRITPMTPSEGGIVWRFDERPEGWQVALAPDFVALSTREYTSRTDLLERLGVVLEAAAAQLRLRFCDRLGVRYVDRITDPELLARIDELVRTQALGAARVDLGHDEVTQTHHFVDALYRLPAGVELHCRWGLLPGKATFDPGVEAAEEPSWVLDLDAYVTEQAFDPATLRATTEELSQRIYRFFRWTVSPEFLRLHGGEV
jgi:uncharacterized protein (TIGR04255 family)